MAVMSPGPRPFAGALASALRFVCARQTTPNRQRIARNEQLRILDFLRVITSDMQHSLYMNLWVELAIRGRRVENSREETQRGGPRTEASAPAELHSAVLLARRRRQEPRHRRIVCLKEVHQQVCILLAAGGQRVVSTIGQEILTGPNQAIAAGYQTVGPVVVGPGEPGRRYRSISRVIVQIGVAVKLILNHAAHGKGGFISIRLRIVRLYSSIRIP